MELKYLNFKKVFKDLVLDQEIRSRWLKDKSFQWALSECFNRQCHIVIDWDKATSPIIVLYKGYRFFLQPTEYCSIFSVYQDYSIELLKVSDKVLDLGACIGGFTLPAAGRCREVIAVEPLFPDLLQDNIDLNLNQSPLEPSNITLLDCCIGPPGVDKTTIKFKSRKKLCNTIDFKGLLSQHGPFDYIKMDIEGGEEYIELPDLVEARVITGEFHINRKRRRRLLWRKWEEFFSPNYYRVSKRGSAPEIDFRFTIERRK